jgi:arylsulfatase A-like enzyme
MSCIHPSKQPNVVFILTDDQGYGDLGCHGNPVIQTPNIDQLYTESIQLENYHVGPTCAPTRAGLYTGHYHNSTGVWHTIGGRSLLRLDEYSLADAFTAAGYQTGLFGKWHLGDNFPYRPQDRGFQEVIYHGGGGVGQTPDYWGNNYNDDHYAIDGAWTSFSGYCTDIWFREGMRFIEHHRDAPFFCFIATNAPHSPYIVDDRYSDPYINQVEHQDRANFYGMITCIDEHVGLLRRQLSALELDENTILIFMTDNGTSGGATRDSDEFIVGGYNAGMRGIKGSAYEGGHRVSFFIHWPGGGLNHGRSVTELTANVDIMPTLLELCGIPDHGRSFDGRSLAPLLFDTAIEWPDRTLVTDSQRVSSPIKWRKSATMTQRWRLINGAELYDIQADPGQRHNIAGQHPEVVTQLRSDYEAWWERVSQQFDGTIPIPIGVEETTLLTAHDWRNEEAHCPWNQSLVRAGMEANGYWEIDVETTGRYRIELRRWPREADLPMTKGMPGELVDFNHIGNGYGGGRAISLTKAGIQVSNVEMTRPVTDDDRFCDFIVELQAGETRLQTFLVDKSGNMIGAYYVYVEMVL